MNGPPMGIPPDPPPPREQVQLGDRVLELEPEAASAVRQAFQNLATTYGQSLDEQRRQILSQLGTPGWQPPPPVNPDVPVGVEIPDTDLLFSNKDAWAAELQASLNRQFGRAAAENIQVAQQTVATVDNELRRRDVAAKAQEIHDTAMEEMLDRRGLGDHRRIVQTIYNEQYANLQHLPLGVALDQIGQLAVEEIASIRGSQAAPREAEKPAAHQPPPLLSSGHRAARSTAPAAPAAHKTLSDLIRARQAAALGLGKAA